MRIPEVAKSGISLAFSIGVIAAIGMATWRYVVIPYRAIPAKPVFSNDNAPAPTVESPIVEIVSPDPPQPQASATPEEKVLYQGTVNAGIGLVLRAEPTQGSGRVGGADYNATVSILKESDDLEWIYIRQDSTSEEGWVRSGNITPL
ncbi:SH3 domain protein [Thalassoporum mexicanum PCC 7367]|uniref:SH3 domain-containing protein n=1 Tax=Thalassoporum mexicanum TaxID=3457544 RepID=UPI00029FB456|nr:SH3 domain-containing protein [Pseudanabaena sp. PCC 7367]AFY69699.1 SH3 domain protein [Pseudanabaena sp. PCC 7367]